MIEKIVLDYLNCVLDVPAYMEEPPNPKSQYIIIEKISSAENNFISEATISIQSYGKSLYEAASLNMQVKSAMREIITLADICRCKLNSDYNYTDTNTKRYRYQALFNIVFYDE